MKSFSREAGSVRLRPMTQGDEALFHALYTDPETMRFVGAAWTPAEAAERFRRVLQRGQESALANRYLVIVEEATGDPLGICGSSHYDPVTMRLELGMMLLLRGRRLGVGRAALGALVDYMFRESPAVEVYARFAAVNRAAENVMARAGFHPGPVAKTERHESATCEWSIFRSEWPIAKSINSRG
ncbi:MAG: GNAT family N-acetyltransferase [Rhodanobacter sp.]